MVRCADFYKKWERDPNWCEKCESAVRQIDEYIELANSLEANGVPKERTFVQLPEGAARPLFSIRDEETRRKALSSVEKCLNSEKDVDTGRFVKNKKLTAGDVQQIVKKAASEVRPTEPRKVAAVSLFNETNDNIEWARWSWNPVTGCLHDCVYCYARDIAKGNQWQPYLYIDATSGRGDNPDEGVPGSPVIFLDEVRRSGIDYRAHFIDRDRETTAALKALVGDDPRATIHTGDNREIVPAIVGTIRAAPYGMLYVDPNGVPPFDMIEQVCLSPAMRLMDVLIRCGATGVKRDFKANDRDARLNDHMDRINKKHWIVSRPEDGDPWQWTFCFGLNTDKVKAYEWLGFHYRDSSRGEIIAHNLNFTKTEAREHAPNQFRLSDFGGMPA